MLQSQQKDVNVKLRLEERPRILTREANEYGNSWINSQTTHRYDSDRMADANSENKEEKCMDTSSLKLHAKCDKNTKG